MDNPALINCPACGAEVSIQASACPRCGHPISAGGGQSHTEQKPQRSKKQSCLIGCLGTFIFLMVMGAIIQVFTGPRTNSDTNKPTAATVTPSQKAVSPSDPAIVERIKRGEQLFKKIKSSPPNPLIAGGFMDYPAVTILVRRDRWDRLSKREQVDLTYYAESLVVDARNNPGKYIDMPSTAPLYRGVEQKVRNLCAECWAVGTTSPSPHAKGEEEDDGIVLGDRVWSRINQDSRLRSLGERSEVLRLITSGLDAIRFVLWPTASRTSQHNSLLIHEHP